MDCFVTFAAIPDNRAVDLAVHFGEFSSGTTEVSAVSDAGKALLGEMFGVGCVSITLPKSKSVDFARFAGQKGLRVR